MHSVETFEQSFDPKVGGKITKTEYTHPHVCITEQDKRKSWSITVRDGQLVVYEFENGAGRQLL